MIEHICVNISIYLRWASLTAFADGKRKQNQGTSIYLMTQICPIKTANII